MHRLYRDSGDSEWRSEARESVLITKQLYKYALRLLAWQIHGALVTWQRFNLDFRVDFIGL